MDQLYLTHVLPIANTFPVCSIYVHELRQLDQEIALSSNQNNIHAALDIPDFRLKREFLKKAMILKLAFEKLKLGNGIKLKRDKDINVVEIDNEMFQVVFFSMGTIPKIKLKMNKSIFLMYRNEFNKIYYCGKLELNEEESKDDYKSFYLSHCIGPENHFFDLKILTR